MRFIGAATPRSPRCACCTPVIDRGVSLHRQVSEGIEVRRHTLTTLDCLQSVGKRCSNADFGNAREGRCESHDGLCECDVASYVSVGGYGVSWSYDDPGVVNLNDEPHRYCVNGDELRLERSDYESGTTYLNIYGRVAN